MTFTIEQLEALKEGTTPGPWKFREHSDYEYPAGPEWGPMQTELEHAVLDAEDNHLFGAYNNYKMIEHPGNVPLAAAAPDLVDALIAEKQAHAKLRAEVAEQRDVYAEDGDSIGASQEEQLTFEAHRQVARDLTDILDVGNE